jgi:hypothetical protein
MNYDGSYDYLGSSIEDLVDALRENTNTLLQNAETQLRTKVAGANIMEQMASFTNDKGFTFDINNKEAWGEEQKKGYLTEFIAQAKANGLDLSQMGIAGLTNNSDIANMSEDSMDAILEGLSGELINKGQNQKDLTKTLTNAKNLSYKGLKLEDNVSASSASRAEI